jgi:hypothetical protein
MPKVVRCHAHGYAEQRFDMHDGRDHQLNLRQDCITPAAEPKDTARDLEITRDYLARVGTGHRTGKQD